MPGHDINLLIKQGVAESEIGNFQKAVSFFEQAILISPDCANLHYYLGCSLREGSKAVYHLKRAIHLNPSYPQAYNNLGRLFHKEKKLDSAEKYYQQAIHYDPYYTDAILNLALLWVLQGKNKLARKNFHRLLQCDAKQPIVYEQLAQLALQDQDIASAYHYYLKRIQFPLNCSDTWNNIGAVFTQMQEPYKAIDAFTQALTINPHHLHARSNLAALYLQHRRLKEAIWEYTLYLRQAPKDVTAYYNLGVAFMLSGRLKEATEAFKESIALYPEYVDSWCNLGAIYVQEGHLVLAYQAYVKALSIAPEQETAQFMVSALQQEHALKEAIPSVIRTIPTMAPASYIKGLFNNYAGYFEQHLLTTLQYQVPSTLYDWIQPYLEGKGCKTLDLGCGTGLVGQVFQPILDELTGVDIAAEMLKEAREKSVYDHLIEQDIIQFIKQVDEKYELILCVDTLVYFGELDTFLKEVFRIAKPNAYLAFSIEVWESDNSPSSTTYYHLSSTGRYQHKVFLVREIAQSYGWQWIDDISITGRLNHHHPVQSHLCLLQVPS